MRTIVIAEIGENHMGRMDDAQTMIREAAKAGAQIAKFQSYRASDVSDNDPEKEWFGKVELSDRAHFELRKTADDVGIEFLSSPFTLERATFLHEQLGLTKMKIASSEMLNVGLLEYVNKSVATVFLSTGMATLTEVEEAVTHLRDVKNLYVLHCVTQYPTKPEDANLLAITILRKRFPNLHVGYSDHTIGIRAAVTAIALGAEVIEKHFTLDKTLPGTDHILSVDPAELAMMIQEIRTVETLLGDAVKKPTPGEASIKSFVRSRFPKT